MKNNFFIFLFLIFFSCQKPPNKEENVLFNKDSDEIVFILELSTKENSVEDIEDFTQYLSDFIVKREPSTVYGYFISEDGKNVTLIERYNNSEDGIQHGKDFINGPNFEKFFQIFTIKSFITLGNATDEFKEFASENGFEIDYRESIGGYVRK
tara:strand:- start:542 stop:1000 length:459 start_codon:yes stop_codon:yes gene_type:complete